MRVLFLLLLAALTGLASCTNEPRPLRLDFIGSSRFTSSNISRRPGDTLSARLYSSVDTTSDATLSRFRVTVTYSPLRNPRLYTGVVNLAKDTVGDPPLVYLDTDLSTRPLRQYVYQTTFGARTTAGREKWEFMMTDSKGHSITRRFQVRVINPDSLSDMHQYILRVPAAPALPPRPYVALLPGLAFPASTLTAEAGFANRELIDMVFRPGNTSVEVYQEALRTARAELHTTRLDTTQFLSLNTPAQLAAQFDESQGGNALSIPLVRNQVVAFRTVDKHRGVFRVRRIYQSPYPILELQVRVKKEAD